MTDAVSSAAAPRASGPQMARLREQAQGFESIFLGMLLKSMRASIRKSGFMDGGRAEEMFTGMMDTALSDRAAKGGFRLGIADMIVKQYSKGIRTAEDSLGKNLDVSSGSPGGSEGSAVQLKTDGGR